MTKYLTLTEALAGHSCYECGDAAASCSYCGESATKHERGFNEHNDPIITCGPHTCSDNTAPDGEFYEPDYVVVAVERQTWDSPGGEQREYFCPPCERKWTTRATCREEV